MSIWSNIRSVTEEELSTLTDEFNSRCETAAGYIAEADVLLFTTGAGFSADSGLAVYADIASVPAYQNRKLTYSDICEPFWLEEEPELFYGFWGSCFNSYRDTKPHEGYNIVRRWRDHFFTKSYIATKLREHQKKLFEEEEGGPAAVAPIAEQEACPEPAGAFYCITSNVDEGLLRSHFSPLEIKELHGNTECWQCHNKCTKATWRAPMGYRFAVNTDTMLAPPGNPMIPATGPNTSPQESSGNSHEVVVQPPDPPPPIEGGGKAPEEIIRYLPPIDHTRILDCFHTNHPTCVFCGGPARPAILMFDDFKWVNPTQRKRDWGYERWKEVVREMAEGDGSRVVILEVGCGNKVPTIRHTNERILNQIPGARLIRVNPQFPFADNIEGDKVLSIAAKGLMTVRTINDALLAGGHLPAD